MKIMPGFAKKNFKVPCHTKEFDLMGLKLALSLPDVKIYSISENSILNQYVPLAKIQNNAPLHPQNKPADAINDFVPLPVSREGGKFLRFFRSLDLEKEYQILKETFLGQLLRDLWLICKTSLLILIKLFLRLFKKSK